MVTSPARILVVSHDPAIRNLISRFLTRQNYEIEATEDGKTAIAVFQQFNPDLVILDSDLPDASGYNLCQEMQSATGVFVLILTNRTDEAARTRAFSQGADDYITKPFSLGELGVRVGAILKRQRTVLTGEQQSLTFENLVIDPVRREVQLNGNLVPLTALEFDLLYFLARNPSRTWNRAELIQEVWDYEYVGDQRVVNVHLGRIWSKLAFHQIDQDNELLKQLRKQLDFLAFNKFSLQHSHLLVVTDDRGQFEISPHIPHFQLAQ
ncbi:response regulator transcription factor [Leptodesmis sichuanensis]|uniref:response regulator transcription factor n=1 Tax=Leptodesmis sichuanensis TaxID=2906798 RepID=UPI001F3CFC39|nr:response regulator transcription factor [Leptodesmis sichuanensis]UIE39541.1 response regulator transcription factor [Leptodesmis sichuanensis A121]